MVATDVASRGIGMIEMLSLPFTLTLIPFLSYLYFLPYRRRVIHRCSTLSTRDVCLDTLPVQASYSPHPGKSWTSGAVCHDSLLAFHLEPVP